MKVTAFILASTNAGKEKDAHEGLSQIAGVTEVWSTYGDFDILARAELEDLDELNALLLNEVRKIPHINTTTTIIGL